MSLTPDERVLRSRLAAYALHAQGKTNTQPAFAAFEARWEKLVDPDGALAPEERARRAEYAKKQHFTKMALNSAKSRRRKRHAA